MNCKAPTIAIRKAGINPATNHPYKPHQFIEFRDDETFIRTYYQQKAIERTMDYEVLVLPCTKCLLCIQAKRRSWACRCINEAQMSNGGVFLTLTCSDESQPRTFPNGSLDHRPWQLFVKRLRKSNALISRKDGSRTDRVRFFMCGEYGEKHHRPHYHALLFGVDFPDRRWVGRSGSGMDLYGSKLLDELRYDADGREIFGPVSNFSDLSPYDISYTVGYVDKKLGRFDPKVYESRGLKPEYVCMSRRPGIGLSWLEKYHGDVWKFYQDECIFEGVNATSDFRYQVPRYYFDKSKVSGLLSQTQCDTILAQRKGRSLELSSDPSTMLESLKRAHDRCAIKEHELMVVKAPRQF